MPKFKITKSSEISMEEDLFL